MSSAPVDGPRPSFTDLGVPPDLLEVLRSRGIQAPFPIQALVLPDAMAGVDVLGRSHTGSGKTLAFALPVVERVTQADAPPAALVLVPTRELAQQVVGEFRPLAGRRGLRVAVAHGGAPLRPQARQAGASHVLVATPGRLEDLASRGLVRLGGVRVLVLDEADRMLDLGFRPQVERLVRRLPARRQTMFFSATLDGETGRMARAFTHDPRTHVVEGGPTVEQAEHRFLPVTEGNKVRALVELLSSEEGRALVFVRTRRGAERLVARLRALGVEAEAMHGDLSQAAREEALARFARGRARTLVATDVAARGLDVEGIARVVNFDPPESGEAYVHRVGRTARAGRSGQGVTLVLPDQQADVGRIARQLDLGARFEEAGLVLAPPRVVYASARGRRSQLAGRRGRRF
ncbi:MAG TPA: DEAD/DEAH box helicase [Actinomycetota bacterium]|nr:DEAD/DEAH box helicase [Actinomycetota bacterium]